MIFSSFALLRNWMDSRALARNERGCSVSIGESDGGVGLKMTGWFWGSGVESNVSTGVGGTLISSRGGPSPGWGSGEGVAGVSCVGSGSGMS